MPSQWTWILTIHHLSQIIYPRFIGFQPWNDPLLLGIVNSLWTKYQKIFTKSIIEYKGSNELKRVKDRKIEIQWACDGKSELQLTEGKCKDKDTSRCRQGFVAQWWPPRRNKRLNLEVANACWSLQAAMPVVVKPYAPRSQAMCLLKLEESGKNHRWRQGVIKSMLMLGYAASLS